MRARSIAAALLLTAVAAPVRSEDARPWEANPLAADPKVVLAAAGRIATGDSDALVLLEDAEYRLDEAGRCDLRYRVAFRVQTAAAVESWASISTEWAPWHQNRPELRARVITPDGVEHRLDPATIAESGVGEDGSEVYSDRRRLRAPLPAIEIGSVVEEEIRTVDRAPLFSVGDSQRFGIGWSVPVLRTRVRVDAPESLPLRHVLRGADGLTVERERADGRVRLLIEAGRLEPRTPTERWTPGDKAAAPQFAFSTGPSWAAVAQAYGRIVDDQIGVTAVAPRPGAKRAEIAGRLLKQLHAEIRYTGVEFGEAAVVPRKPAEVLARRYGDCKDKATLLVSRLRAEGVPAYVALLLAGYGSDVDADLPALGVFNHAIVVLPGEPRLWIDPTDEFARVDELPLGDQGRLALIAAAETDALVRIPTAAAAANVMRKTREYRLSETGSAHLVETTVTSGSVEDAYRSYFAHTSTEKRQENRDKYAKAEHGAVVVAARSSEPHDLSAPFEVRMEADTKVMESDGNTLRLKIKLGSLFSRVPEDLIENGSEEHEPRRSAFFVVEPHRIEWTYRIVPPSGFVLKRLPATENAALGPARLEAKFEQQPSGTIEGQVTFDSGPRVLEPKEFEAIRSGIGQWLNRELAVELEDEAMALVAAGRACEGLDRLRHAVEKDPKRGALRGRLSSALLTAGFGEAAREEARRGVDLDGTSSTAHRLLGEALEHDALGRRFKPGWDRAAADAEYRKAIELDAKDERARMSLAILHTYNDDGVQFGEGAPIEESVKEAKAFRADLENSALDINGLLGLMWLGRFEELERVANTLPETVGRNELMLVAAAMQRGAKVAIAEAATLFPDVKQRRDALQHAGNSLAQLREYPTAAALLSESAQGADEAAARRSRADLMSRVRRYDELKLSDDDPRHAVIRMLIASVEDGSAMAHPTRFADVMALTEAERASAEKGAADLRRAVLAGVRWATGGSVVLTRPLVDIAVAMSSFGVEGTPETGFRVRQKMGEVAQTIYVVRRDGRCRVLATGAQSERVAEEVWDLLEAGNLKAAQQWLDWLREDMRQPVSDDDPFMAPPLLELWKSTGPRDLAAARAGTSSLFEDPVHVLKGIEWLTAWRETLTEERTRLAVDSALLALYRLADKKAEGVGLAQEVLRTYPRSKAVLIYLAYTLRALGRSDEARALCQEHLRERPDDGAAWRALAGVESWVGHYAAAEAAYSKIFDLGQGEAGDWNNRAWNAILSGTIDDNAIEWGQRAVQANPKSNRAILHTLATLYAEKGRVKETQQLLAQSLAMAMDEPSGADWYVVGRIAEQCGLLDVARQAYRRVKPKESLEDTGVLAERALARLPKAETVARKAASRK
jgi:tetratricopeptide (TPR) repeat protein/transglutaminase-like putative cysteine protease